MKTGYLFLCPKCSEAYTSDNNLKQSCPKCGHKLIELPIDLSDW